MPGHAAAKAGFGRTEGRRLCGFRQWVAKGMDILKITHPIDV